ncbi:type II toxin-antitoxin system VapC family toxin [Kribbella sp. NPDC020789]
MLVLDTNVVSELMRPTPDAAVLGWLAANRSYGVYTTAITVAEIRLGIARMPDGRRKDQLAEAADDVFVPFADSILAFDATVAGAFYAEVVVGRAKAGLPIATADAMIAAICRAPRATLVTRNPKDFVETGLELVNPWE